jgi:hypothetical protein
MRSSVRVISACSAFTSTAPCPTTHAPAAAHAHASANPASCSPHACGAADTASRSRGGNAVPSAVRRATSERTDTSRASRW